MNSFNYYLDVLKKYAVFSGRASRAEYWYFVLFNVFISLALWLIDSFLFSDIVSQIGLGLLGGLYAIGVFIPSLAVAVRRLHDTNRSGWWTLISLIPVSGLLISNFLISFSGSLISIFLIPVSGLLILICLISAIVLIVFLAQDSKPGENKYGKNPKEALKEPEVEEIKTDQNQN